MPPSEHSTSSGLRRSPLDIAEQIRLVLDQGTSHAQLQAIKVQLQNDVAEECRRIEDPEEHNRLLTLSLEDVHARVAALHQVQAILRAFLLRIRENLSFWDDEADYEGREGGATALLQQQEGFEALVAESKALIGGYSCLLFVRRFVDGDDNIWHHTVDSLSMPFLPLSHASGGVRGREGEYFAGPDHRYGQDFATVRGQVLHHVWGLDETTPEDLPRHRAPLESLLGAWWRPLTPGRRGRSGRHPPPCRLLSVKDALWVPWRVLTARLLRGPETEDEEDMGLLDPGRKAGFLARASAEASHLQLLTLYALVDACWVRDKGQISVHALRQRAAEPFARAVDLPCALGVACVAFWAADGPNRREADVLALAVGRGKGGGAGRGRGLLYLREGGGGEGPYRQLLWLLAFWGRYGEVSHLLDVAPPPALTDLDACLKVGALLGLGQWEQAFVQQRRLASPPGGALARLPAARRYAPLALLAHGLVAAGKVGRLTSLPFSPVEVQHVVSTLYVSELAKADAAVLALLLRRKEFARAWATFHLVMAGEEGGREGEGGSMKTDLGKLIQGVERFIPKEELNAMKRARAEGGGGEEEALLMRFARMNPLADEEGEGREGDEKEGREAPQEEGEGREEGGGRRAEGGAGPGGDRRGSTEGDVGSDESIYGRKLRASLRRAGDEGDGEPEDAMDVYISREERPGRPRASGRGVRGEGVGQNVRFPPVVLRPGRTARFDSFNGGGRGGDVNERGHRVSAQVARGRREEELI